MRILVCTPFSGADAGGGDAHVADSAAALRGAGHEVVVLAGSGDRADELVAGLDFGHVTDGALRSVTETVTAAAPDVVHFHMTEDERLGRAVRNLAPLARSAHGFVGCTSGMYYYRPGHECSRAHGPLCLAHLVAHGCSRRPDPRRLLRDYARVTRTLGGLNEADITIAYSSYVFEHLRRNGIQRLARVPLCITAPNTVLTPPERFTVAFVGRVAEEKGLGTVIRAMSSVAGELRVYGDGWWRGQAEQLAVRLGLSERVHFEGWTSRERVSKAISEANVVTVPSHWPEPFGLVGPEAMAAGRPVVASATGGTVEWLRGGVNGLLARPGDCEDWARALTALQENRAYAARLGANGRRDVMERFSAARHVAGLMDAYDVAVAHWKGGSGGGGEPRAPAESQARGLLHIWHSETRGARSDRSLRPDQRDSRRVHGVD